MKFAQTKGVDKPLALNRFTLFNNEIDRILTISMGFSVALVMARVAYTGKFTFAWLIWNLFLAWFPYVISSWLQQRPAIMASRIKFAAVSILWLLLQAGLYVLLPVALTTPWVLSHTTANKRYRQFHAGVRQAKY